MKKKRSMRASGGPRPAPPQFRPQRKRPLRAGYAEVYGVPFSFIPTDGSTPAPPPTKPVTRVRALEDRAALEMCFPRLLGYRYDLPPEKLTATFTADSRLILTTADVPTETENAPIVGQSSFHSLADLKRQARAGNRFRAGALPARNFFPRRRRRHQALAVSRVAPHRARMARRADGWSARTTPSRRWFCSRNAPPRPPRRSIAPSWPRRTAPRL